VRDVGRGVTLQLCPKCNGQGTVAKPPWIPGDVHTWNSGTLAPYVCNLCEGRMVIAQPDAAAPLDDICSGCSMPDGRHWDTCPNRRDGRPTR
jgi:DnaJ-class molecular chaperone